MVISLLPPPSRACFAHEKVPFFQKPIIFLYGDTTKCDVLQRNATRFGRNWPIWRVLPPKWTVLKKRPCGWLPLNHLDFIDYYTNKTQGWLSTREITCTYIPLTMLRATGLKWFKVMWVQFINSVNNQLSVLFVFYFFLNNKWKYSEYYICQQWLDWGSPLQIKHENCFDK